MAEFAVAGPTLAIAGFLIARYSIQRWTEFRNLRLGGEAEFIGEWSILDTLYQCKPFFPSFPKRKWSATICSDDSCLFSHIMERIGQRTTYFTGDLYPFTSSIEVISVSDSLIEIGATGESILSETCHEQMSVVSKAVRYGDAWLVADAMAR